MNIQTYLARIKYTAPVSAAYETLCGLQLAHMLTVPFENLDIVPLGRAIQLDEKSLWHKIIEQGRGGFCYELNGLFAWLLKHIGFDVTCLNARVFNREGKLGIEFDHLVLLVRIPNQPTRWLADVGFGDSFTEPLNFEVPGEQVQGPRAYRLESTTEGFIAWQRNYDGRWERQFFFDLQARNFPSDYEAGCRYHQTSPRSSFTRGSIVSMAKPDGRVTLEEKRLILTKNGRREEEAVANHEEYTLLLKERFGIIL